MSTSTLKTFSWALFLTAHQLAAEVLASFQQEDKQDSHLARLPALYITDNQPVTPLLDSGPFEVTWSGTLAIEKRQRLYFSFEGLGSAQLTINDKEVLSEAGLLGEKQSERLRLNSGEHSFSIHYQSPKEGTARFQLFWEERAFPKEPIPPKAFGKIDPSLAKSTLAYQGREIFARHLCAKCHLPQDGFGSHAMPELGHIPPILGLTGDRLNESWLARSIANPASIRSDTNMPQLVPNNEQGRQQAADLAAYLMTFKTSTATKPLTGSIQEGGAVFHKLACVTCHGLPNETSPSEERIPLTHLFDKFQPDALKDFLLEPAKLSPHTRMPNFRLSEEEASALACYLLDSSSQVEHKALTFPKGDAVNGSTLSMQMHCGACHAGLPYDPASLPPFESIIEKPWTTAPCFQSENSHLNLPPEAGEALEALRNEHLSSLKKNTPAFFAERQLRNLRCNACHTYDDRTALLNSLHSQSASLAAHLNLTEKVDQSLPRLTHIGEMLHTDYLSSILQGTVDTRPRPWLDTRMPGFANHRSESFAAGLAALHGLAPSTATEHQFDLESINHGEKLIGSEAGFSCTTCHGIGPKKPTAAFEVMGINFNLTKHRLRESFFYHWMHDPSRITPNSKMPRYADDQGKTSLPDLDNDSRLQFEAIWKFLQTQNH